MEDKTMEIAFLYIISFVILIYVSWNIGIINAKLDMILKLLKNEENESEEVRWKK